MKSLSVDDEEISKFGRLRNVFVGLQQVGIITAFSTCKFAIMSWVDVELESQEAVFATVRNLYTGLNYFYYIYASNFTCVNVDFVNLKVILLSVRICIFMDERYTFLYI